MPQTLSAVEAHLRGSSDKKIKHLTAMLCLFVLLAVGLTVYLSAR